MNVVSLFDGMSCCRIALDKLGVDVGKYYASEIDKYAIQVSKHNWSDALHVGDVTKWREWDIDWSSIDLVTGGFPCQAWSVAGKQMGDKDPRGMLFWDMLDIMKHARLHNPNVHFLIENVKMKSDFEEYITKHTELALGKTHKELINSALVSAQNRNRYYWTSFPVSQPEDKGLLLKDIIKDGYVDRSKSHCIDANYFRGGNFKSYFLRGRRQLVFIENGQEINCNINNGLLEFTKDQRKNLDIQGFGFRKLTPTECEILQTVPVGYTDCVSNMQRYKMLGNGWTVDVITHILKHII